MSNDDLFHELFAEAMQHVQPIDNTAKVTPASPSIKQRTRRSMQKNQPIAAHHLPQPNNSTLKQDASTWVLRANGVAPNLLKKLSTGQLSIHRTIDLHGMTRDQAIAKLEGTLLTSLQAQERVLCIIHGRGLHSSDGQPVLKKSVYQWLQKGGLSGYILAVTPSPNSAGGSCLVLLRRDKHA